MSRVKVSGVLGLDMAIRVVLVCGVVCIFEMFNGLHVVVVQKGLIIRPASSYVY